MQTEREELIQHIAMIITKSEDSAPAEEIARKVIDGWEIRREVIGTRVTLHAALPPRPFSEEESATVAKVREAVTWSATKEGPPVEFTSHLDLVEQDVWWKSGYGAVKITDMDDQHIINVLNLLENKVSDLRAHYAMRYLMNAPDDVFDDDERTPDTEWFEEQPLIKAMRVLLERRLVADQ